MKSSIGGPVLQNKCMYCLQNQIEVETLQIENHDLKNQLEELQKSIKNDKVIQQQSSHISDLQDQIKMLKTK